jgi:quercetin dioxygenase-like cupin family protein
MLAHPPKLANMQLSEAGQRSSLMDRNAFDAQLKADGYTEIETKTLAPRPANEGHGHPYAVRGLVLAGVFTVIRDGKPTAYRPGQTFAVAAGIAHSEEVGTEGAQILVGRKY